MTTSVLTKQDYILGLKSKNLVVKTLSQNEILNEKKIILATNHILTIDCSGSMYSELPKIRQQIKNKLVDLVKDNDTVSIVWFSGRGECGILKEEVEIKSLKDLSDLHKNIDKYLTDVCLTGFKEPLELIKEVVDRISKNRPNSAFNLMFLTDGYDNQWSTNEILKACEALKDKVTSSTFVEYGNYANTKLLNQMAETLSGTVIYSERFTDYEPIFESIIRKEVLSTKKIEIDIPNSNYVVDENGIYYNVLDGKVLVSEGVKYLTYLTDKTISTKETLTSYVSDYVNTRGLSSPNRDVLNVIYTLIASLAQRMKSKDVYEILESLGDISISNSYCNAFGKQPLNAFLSEVRSIASGESQPFTKGFDVNSIPSDNKFCVLNLINMLMSDEESRWYPKHEKFVYHPISAKRVQASSVLTEEDHAKINDLTQKLQTADVESLKIINEEINSILSKKQDLKFVTVGAENGYEISKLVWNTDRPNLSVSVTYKGYVELPENKFGIKSVDTVTFRNYSIIANGIVNVDILPVSFSEDTYKVLVKNNIVSANEPYEKNKIFFINLKRDLSGDIFPVVNRSMTKDVSGMELFKQEIELQKLKAKQRVFNHFFKENFPSKNEGLVSRYGEEATEWLKSLGFSDGNGFSPKSVSSKSGEIRMESELACKIASFSTLPSVNALLKKIQSNKNLTPSESLLNVYYKEYLNFIESDIYTKTSEKNKENLLKVWLEDKAKETVKEKRDLENHIAQSKFGLILSQGWFTDFDDMDNTSTTLTIDNVDYKVSFNLAEVEEKL